MLNTGRFIFDGTPEEMNRSEDRRVRRFVEGRADDEDMDKPVTTSAGGSTP
jgi:ABC-type transporter Mla maintaining outer membrane lipid asymmetry ATPase subunit MlaF